MIVYFFIGFLGLCMGSFLSVIVSRLDRKGGILMGRSECPDCHKILAWYDLIPVLSYVLLRGRCRYCSSRISIVYPLFELTSSLVFISYFLVNGLNLGIEDIYYLSLLVLLTSLIFFDALYLILPDKIVIPMALLAILYDIFFRRVELLNLLLSAFLFSLVFAIIYLISKGRAMGFGDVKLALALGLIFGYPVGFFSIIIAVWAAALWGLALVVTGKANLKTALPFGSYLSASAIFFIICGKIIEKIDLINIFSN
jgi:leader peptidase (prepilin peptidase)/N-methyltransferase